VTEPPAPDAEAAPQQAPEVAPLDVDGVAAVAVGTVLWAVALVACLIFRVPLSEAGNAWWTWVCAAGALLGLAGLWFVRRRRDAYRRAASRSEA
jgi:MYXO-CTERM domain-containing protein